MADASNFEWARKLCVWFGRRSAEIKRGRSPESIAENIMSSGAFPVDAPIGDVMNPVDMGEINKAEEQKSSDKDDALKTEVRLTKVLKDVIHLQDEIDGMRKGLGDEGLSVLEHIGSRLEEILERSGASAIDGEEFFDIRRHRPNPVRLVKDGTLIMKTEKAGWREGDVILRRALVKVAELS